MGGRGTFAVGNKVEYTYETVDKIEGVKVLHGLNGKHGLPAEAHSSMVYIKLKPNGVFQEMRIYDEDHYLIREVAYHPEPNLNHGTRVENVLHIHEYQRDDFENRPAHLMTEAEYAKYKKFLKGVPTNAKRQRQ